MKPRTKLHHLVLSLSKELPELTAEQKKYAFKNYLNHWGYRTKTNTSCLDCGHIWKAPQEVKTCDCPKCGTKLEIKDTRKKKVSQSLYVCMLTVIDGFQVNRFYEMGSHHKAGKPVSPYIWEVTQQFMKPDKKGSTLVSRVHNLNWYQDSFSGDMEIRDANAGRYTHMGKYNLYAKFTFPRAKVLPIYKQHGFKGSFGQLTPYEMFNLIVNNQRAETLLKAKQMSLLNAMTEQKHVNQVDRYWASIKIAMRHKYIIKDAGMWLDHLDILAYLAKDLHSPVYVCPANLVKEHNRAVAKKTAIEKRRQLEKRRKRVEREQVEYAESKGVYFGLVFTEGELTVSVMTSVRQVMEEGDLLKHCVFASEYHKREKSLLLSAQVNNVPVETVEVSLGKYQIEQARGQNNGNSPYHHRILELVNSNMAEIKKVSRPKKVKKNKSKEQPVAA